MSQTRRKAKFVHAGIQGRLALRLVGQWAMFVCFQIPVVLFLQLAFNPVQDEAVLRQQLNISLASFGVVAACLLPIFTYDWIQFSHRFVGPIVRLHRVVQQAEPSGSPRISLRRKDFWLDLAVDFNAMLQRFEQAAKPCVAATESPPPSAEPSGALVDLATDFPVQQTV